MRSPLWPELTLSRCPSPRMGCTQTPVRAYSEAIKAVESAAHAIVETNNTRNEQETVLQRVAPLQRPGIGVRSAAS